MNLMNLRGGMPEKYFDYYDMPNKRMNPYRGWEIYPKVCTILL